MADKLPRMETLMLALPTGTQVCVSSPGYYIALPARYAKRDFTGGSIRDAATSALRYIAGGQHDGLGRTPGHLGKRVS